MTKLNIVLATLVLSLLVGCGSNNNGGNFVAPSVGNGGVVEVVENNETNSTKPETAKKVEKFSGYTESVEINLSDFLGSKSTVQHKVSGEFVSRETDDFNRIYKAIASVWYDGIYEEMDINFLEEFTLKIPNAQDVEFHISLVDMNNKELFFGSTIYSGNPEKLSVELNYNTWRESQMYVNTIERLPELPFDVSDLDKPNAVIYFADGSKSDAIALEGEGDKSGFKLSQVLLNKNGSLEIDNHWSLRDLPVKMVLESGREIYFDFQLYQFALKKETLIFEKEVETEVSLVDSRLKDFKEGVVYNGEQNSIAFQTDKVYYLICTPSEKDPMQDPILTVNGDEFDDSQTMYPEPVLLEVGMQNISVRNLSDSGSGFELQIIPEDEYIDGLIEEI